MKILKLKVGTTDLDSMKVYIIKNFEFQYENHSADMTILATEDFYFRNNSTQLNMIVAKREESALLIDVIGGAGGAGLLNINWWSEKSYTGKVNNLLQKYAKVNDLTIQEI
jgi:hypothetical protein